MARKEEVCGAVTGGILVLGLRFGRGGKDDRSATELTYGKTTELMDLFSQEHGTFVCRKLLNGCELTSAEGQKFFKENELLNKVCMRCVQSVVRILEGILQRTSKAARQTAAASSSLDFIVDSKSKNS